MKNILQTYTITISHYMIKSILVIYYTSDSSSHAVLKMKHPPALILPMLKTQLLFLLLSLKMQGL